MKTIIKILILSVIFLLLNTSCKKDPKSPSITTTSITSITDTSVVTGGTITSDGGNAIEVRGVCWGTTVNPTIGVNTTQNSYGTGEYISTIKGFLPGTLYHVRAYAINSLGAVYGQDVTFTSNVIVPKLSTTDISLITTSTASSGGKIISDGGGTIISTGICWNTIGNPTINDFKTIDVNNNGTFLSNLSSLEGSTRYFVRSYATNKVGTSYGNQKLLWTKSNITATDYDGNVYQTITIGTQVWMAENLKTTHYRNGDNITYFSANIAENEIIEIGGYNWYNDSIKFKNIYGANYNWFAYTDSRNLCPVGWHIPSLDEWNTLINYLDGPNVAAGKMKEDGLNHWKSPNEADNSSGFNALPAGDGFEMGDYNSSTKQLLSYNGLGYWARFGSSTRMQYYVSSYIIELDNTNILSISNDFRFYYTVSVRCIKD